MVPFLSNPATALRLGTQLAEDLGAGFGGEYADRPKDTLHTLSGLKIRESATRAWLDSGAMPLFPPFLTVADMMHRPVRRMLGRECPEGTLGRCVEVPGRGWEWGDRPSVTIDFDFRVHPTSEPSLVRRGERRDGDDAIPDRPLVCAHNIVDWSDGNRVHLAVMPAGRLYYVMYIWFGEYDFDHLEKRDDVLMSRSCLHDGRIAVRFPVGSTVSVVEVTSVEPTRFHVWDVTVGDALTVSGPRPSSY